MTNKIISNTSSTHLAFIKDLFASCSGRVVIASPFLAQSVKDLLKKFTFSNVKEMTIITTFKTDNLEQLSKPFQLKDFFEFFMENYPHVKINIHISNGLHGKIYACINEKCSSLVITSANFTNNGLLHNDEWGYLVDNESEISYIIDDLYSTIDYFEVTYNQIKERVFFPINMVRRIQNGKYCLRYLVISWIIYTAMKIHQIKNRIIF